VVQETVAVPQTVVVQETVLVVVTATPLPPTPTPEGPSPTPTKTLIPSKTPIPTKTNTPTRTNTPTKAPTATKTETRTKAPTPTRVPTRTRVPTPTKEPLQGFIGLLNKTGVNAYVAAVTYGGSPNSIEITVRNAWFYEPKQVRLQAAQALWEGWAAGFCPEKETSDLCRIRLVDSMGNRVGGSSWLLGSIIDVND